MKINIDNKEIEANDINIIAIDGLLLPARRIFYNGHIVVCKKDGQKIRCFKNLGLNLFQLEEILLDIGSDVSQNGAKNFTPLTDRFLINIKNIQQMHFKSNLCGLHLVEAEFQNGHIVEIYKGRNEKYAIDLFQQYKEREEEYLNIEQVKA